MVVNEIKVKDSSKREIEWAKQEVLNEVSVVADLGDFLATSRISSNVLHSEQFLVFYQFGEIGAAFTA